MKSVLIVDYRDCSARRNRCQQGCNYSGTIQLTVACPVPAGTVCCAATAARYSSAVPVSTAVNHNHAGSGHATAIAVWQYRSSICRILRIPVASRSWIMRLFADAAPPDTTVRKYQWRNVLTFCYPADHRLIVGFHFIRRSIRIKPRRETGGSLALSCWNHRLFRRAHGCLSEIQNAATVIARVQFGQLQAVLFAQ